MDKLTKVRIIKGIGGFYYVHDGETVHECRASGKFRKEKMTPTVGDYVVFDVEKCFIEKILERKNYLMRPPVSNIDQILIVVSPINPAPDFFLIDKLTALAISKNITPIIAINKIDLRNYKSLKKIYGNFFQVIQISAKFRKNIGKLKKALKGNTTALAGNSGVGKSTIIRALGLDAEIGETSKIQRGKHTTRHVEIMELGKGTYIMDTPGFSLLDTDIEGDIVELFPEIQGVRCLFADCTHRENAKGCAIHGKLSPTRMDSFLKLQGTSKATGLLR